VPPALRLRRGVKRVTAGQRRRSERSAALWLPGSAPGRCPRTTASRRTTQPREPDCPDSR
jgi:hypothetical protein